jgi:hypothetical protein
MKEVEIKLAPEDLHDENELKGQLAKAARIPLADVKSFRIIRRSLDARYRPPVYLVKGYNLSSGRFTCYSKRTGQFT